MASTIVVTSDHKPKVIVSYHSSNRKEKTVHIWILYLSTWRRRCSNLWFNDSIIIFLGLWLAISRWFRWRRVRCVSRYQSWGDGIVIHIAPPRFWTCRWWRNIILIGSNSTRIFQLRLHASKFLQKTINILFVKNMQEKHM